MILPFRPTNLRIAIQNRLRSPNVNPDSFLNKCSMSSRFIVRKSASLTRCSIQKESDYKQN